MRRRNAGQFALVPIWAVVSRLAALSPAPNATESSQNVPMSANPLDDDPTHALDDFVRRMRSAAAPSPPVALPEIDMVNGRPGTDRAPPQGAGSGRFRGGQGWARDDVFDVPDKPDAARPLAAGAAAAAELPAVALPPVDLATESAQAATLPAIDWPAIAPLAPLAGPALDESVRRASDFAADQWRADAHAATEPAWQPDPQSLQLRTASDPRLLARWRPGAWIGARRQVLAGRTEFVNGPAGPAVETYPAHWLLLLWPPLAADRPLTARWPQRVRLWAWTRGGAEHSLLADIPDADSLWLADASDGIDWALAADIALHHEPALRPFQIEGLRDFIAAEREAGFGRVNDSYARDSANGAVVQR